MLIGDSPFSGDDEDELFASIKEKAITFPAGTDKKAQDIIMAFLCREAPNRLGTKAFGCPRTTRFLKN